MNDVRHIAELVQAITEIEPAARLVPARALRRAIRTSRDRGDFHTAAVHDRCWRVQKDRLFQWSFPSEVGLDLNDPCSEFVLIPIPEEWDDPFLRVKLQQTLFHAALDQEFDAAVTAGRIDSILIRSIREQLGPARWHVLQTVLTEENLIGPHEANQVILRECISFGMEILYFRPDDWDTFFPGLPATEEPFRTIGSLIPVQAIFERTHLAGATVYHGQVASSKPEQIAVGSTLSQPALNRILSEADRGNDLLAAVRLYAMEDPRAVDYLNRLLQRLQSALNLDADTLDEWRTHLRGLLPQAATGGWPPARRILYELQRACLAIEKTSFSIGLIDWVRSFGRVPIVRPLPKTKWLNATRRLRAAERHASRHMTDAHDSHAFSHLLLAAAVRTEREARKELRPELRAVLQDVGLVPQSMAERHSFDKSVEELLDVACARGFLRIGDLRDAIARGRVKLSDLAGPGEFLRGDPILQANSRLPERMPGVYRRGEVYMRLLQRGCSLFFGTHLGRLFTKFVALPFGGAFIILEGLHHMKGAAEGAINWITGWNRTVEGFSVLAGGAAGTVAEDPSHGESWVNAYTIGLLGAVLLLLIHLPQFRRLVAQTAKFLFVKLPRAVRHSRIVLYLLNNVMTRFVRKYMLIPAITGALAGFTYNLITRDWTSPSLVGFGVALFMGSFFRTPIGRTFEDRLDEALTRFWRIVSVNFAVGVLTYTVQFFQAVFEAIDRSIYAVDEWLRFQEGDRRGSIWLKAVFGAFWSAFTYVFRFAWTLLVEPQINPIKHFPVVTVSHKMLLPLIPSLAKQFAMSEKTMGTIVFGIPGIFGFLVWELKENWKLYRVNASPTIRPVVIGSHGEKMRSLLRPGFHSGVVPKTFAKLRKATRASNVKRSAKYQHALEHVSEAIHRLMERSFIPYLASSQRWGGIAIRAGIPVLSPNRILMSIEFPERGGSTTIAIEERGGWVIAGIAESGPLLDLDEEAQAAFVDSLTGLYKLAGVDAIREQAVRVFGRQAFSFDAVPEGLMIPMADGSLMMHDYDDGPELRTLDRTLPTKSIVFSECPLSWADWSERWEADAVGKAGKAGTLIPGWSLVPGKSST